MTEEAPNTAPAEELTANTNQAPANEPAATTEQTSAQPAETTQTEEKKPYFSDAQLAEMQKFAENNGGFDKVFGAMKNAISNPKPQEPAQQPVQQPAEASKTEAAQQPVQPKSGHMTRDEFFALQYFDSLSKDPKYANVAEQIRNGDALKEMAKFGINAINGDDINDTQVRQFLDMYSKANAPAQAVAPVTNTPTVDYVEVKEINSMKDVDEIMRQNITLKAQGKPLHPQTEAAKKFATEYFKKK